MTSGVTPKKSPHTLILRRDKREPQYHLWESGHPTPTSGFRWGFRMPLAEPGVRLSIRTGLSVDVYA